MRKACSSGAVPLLVEPDRAKRYRMFEFVPKPLDDLVPAGHLLRRLESCIDFRLLAAPLARAYEAELGRPAIPPEVLVRALVIGYVYGIPSFRRLCAAIHENIAFRWFLFLGLEDEVFDHSTISVFLRRVGPAGFRALLQHLNEQLRRSGFFSDEAFVDSTLVPAAVSSQATGLSPTTLSPEAFAEVAQQANGIFSTCEALPTKPRSGRGVARRRLVRRWFQDARGQLPLHPRDLDARWRKVSKGRPAVLGYKQHVLVDRHGFILAQQITHATTRDADPVPALLNEAPIRIRVLGADTGYSLGRLRRFLAQRGIEAHIPLHSRHREHRHKRQGFDLTPDGHLRCPAGKLLRKTTYYAKDETWLYAARVSDCQACPLKRQCLSPRMKRRFVQLSVYEAEFQRAEARGRSARFRRVSLRRKAIIEGVFARIDRLGFRRARRFGLEDVQCEGYLAAVAHNMLKALRCSRHPGRGAGIRSSYAGALLWAHI